MLDNRAVAIAGGATALVACAFVVILVNLKSVKTEIARDLPATVENETDVPVQALEQAPASPDQVQVPTDQTHDPEMAVEQRENDQQSKLNPALVALLAEAKVDIEKAAALESLKSDAWIASDLTDQIGFCLLYADQKFPGRSMRKLATLAGTCMSMLNSYYSTSDGRKLGFNNADTLDFCIVAYGGTEKLELYANDLILKEAQKQTQK